MIVTEYYDTRPDSVKLYRTFSDNQMRIRQDQTGAVYDEAIDVENSGYTYTETDEPIEQDDSIEAKAEAYDIITGVIP